ncbi:VTT domain-containing protein [Nocardioides sp. ChNu-153]|uniref:DedA family protein n=1 Tax=unclassified Nocardioides TaxID=2615069 RepID=UPI002405B422|nr:MULTISPECIES: VTT domain-containing protein [unclassified Nocardioides]MDF9715682.1 VTT domain-containing protein [Nocardioides sp. ChNu-99]MDN7121665.1 VTT domain-containing protein [Nocardioides sp. ChNu-153]
MDAVLDLARSSLGSPWLYVAVLLLVVVDCFLPAVPSDEVIIAVAALTVASGDPWALLVLLAVAVVGALIGDSIGFAIGGRLPRERLREHRRFAKFIEAADRQFARRGARIVVTARFLPVIRIGVNLVAGGALRYRVWLPLALSACLLWGSFTVGVGAVAGFGLSDQPWLAMGVGMVLGLCAGVAIDKVASARERRRSPEDLVPASAPSP